MRTILLTGNEGYIGSVLTEQLIAAGYEVVGMDTGIFSDVEFVPKKAKVTRQIYKDIRDAEVSDFEGIDIVMHLAALSKDPLGELNPQITYDINHIASVRLAELAKEAGVQRFLYSSSCSTYGVQGGGFATEEAEVNPQTAYAIAKMRTEDDVSKLADDSFCPVYLRNSTVFGISPRLRLDLVAHSLAAYGHIFGEIAILSDGLPWRPLVHVRDVSDAFIFLSEVDREKVFNQKFNIGHKENNVQVKDIAEMVQNVMPSATVDIKNEHASDQRSYRVDFSKLYSLGFEPKYTLKDGLQEICDVFKSVNLNEDDFNSDKYITLKRYQRLINEGKMDHDLRLTSN